MHHCRTLLGVAWLLACPSLAAAQPAIGPHAASDRTWEVEPYVGVARHSPAGSHLGVTADRNHVFIGVHVTAAVLRWRGFTLAYAPEIVRRELDAGRPRAREVWQLERQRIRLSEADTRGDARPQALGGRRGCRQEPGQQNYAD